MNAGNGGMVCSQSRRYWFGLRSSDWAALRHNDPAGRLMCMEMMILFLERRHPPDPCNEDKPRMEVDSFLVERLLILEATYSCDSRWADYMWHTYNRNLVEVGVPSILAMARMSFCSMPDDSTASLRMKRVA